MNLMFRQGDVLIVAVDKMPDDFSPVPRENGAVVLAHGEATGHTHAVRAKNATLYAANPMSPERSRIPSPNADRFLRIVKRNVRLLHEEHGAIVIGPGIYKVIRQREYSPEAIRNVAD